jgi:hypothetical protein
MCNDRHSVCAQRVFAEQSCNAEHIYSKHKCSQITRTNDASTAATLTTVTAVICYIYNRSEMSNNECARPFPAEGSIYDYKYSEEACDGSGSWIGWMDSVEVYKLDPKLGFSELIVPTADSICYTFLLDQVSDSAAVVTVKYLLL